MARVRHLLEHATVSAVAGAVQLVPRPLLPACGTLIGRTFYALDAPHRRLAGANLATAFPTQSVGERSRIVRETFEHFGRLLVELLRFSRLSPDEMCALVEFEGAERIRQAHACRRGVLYYTGHFGYWELAAIVHGAAFGRVAVLARALDNRHLNALLERIRTCTGNSVIYRKAALRRVLRTLAENRGVALLIDQHIHGTDAVHVDFFGRPAATTSALATLAIRTGAPVVPVFALPAPAGRYRLVYEQMMTPPAQEEPEAVRDFTQQCTTVLEQYVRRHPELWLWMHRRWREVEPPGGDGGGFAHPKSQLPNP